MGLTSGGAIGASTAPRLEDCPALITAIAEPAIKVNPNIIVLCHGGPIAEPADADFVLQRCPLCHGFYGASSMERLPTEVAIRTQTRAFLDLRPTQKSGIES